MDAITAEEARALLQREEDERLRQCAAEVEEVLARHRCRAVAVVNLTQDGRITAAVQLQVE